MDFEKNEEEIRKELEALKYQQPPASVMKDFDKDVMKRVQSQSATPYLGMGLALGFAVLLACAGFLLLSQQPKSSTVVIEEPLDQRMASPKTVRSEESPKIEKSEPKAESIERPAEINKEKQGLSQEDSEKMEMIFEELFILEMLGEDEDLLEDMSRLETDIEIWNQLNAPAVSGVL